MNTKSLEIELKLQVDSAAHLERVAGIAGGERQAPIAQVNHFFDTKAHSLLKRGMAFRLREETQEAHEKRWFLAFKGERIVDDETLALVRRREIEIAIDEPLASSLLAGDADLIAELISKANEEDAKYLEKVAKELASPLVYIGHFENVRVRINTILIVEGEGLDVVLELDTTTFPNKSVDYEIEVELPHWVPGKNAEMALRSLMAIAGVKGRSAPSKAARYLETL